MEQIKVVIVEDDPQTAEIHRRFVEKNEVFQVIGIAHSQAEALDLIEVLLPDLVLLDMYLPDGDGLSILKQIRQADLGCDVIMLTAAKEATTLQQALRSGVFDYVLKPVVLGRLQDSLQKFLDHKEKMTQLGRLQQTDVDPFLPSRSDANVTARLPKGIDPLTLDKIRELFSDGQSHNAEETGEKTGTSRTTARRYLEHLVTAGELKAELIYGSVGRPERSYCRV